MTKHSEEGNINGLGWIDAQTKKFDLQKPFKVPHMGWNNVTHKKDSVLAKELNNEASFYFVHSYYVSCNVTQDILFETQYGHDFVSGFQKENIYGVQFHPEKSHRAGLQLMQNFIAA
ncbi:MAG: imidazole glycerol phosphate synthase subunit HisH [Sphingobacteriaceae bacterium]|nr:imidazole glycerol phosphate synthase subunit HisH [Sphingobacteriaceae bacterium]